MKIISKNSPKFNLSQSAEKKIEKFALAAIPEIKARIKPVSSAREDDKCPEGNLLSFRLPAALFKYKPANDYNDQYH